MYSELGIKLQVATELRELRSDEQASSRTRPHVRASVFGIEFDLLDDDKLREWLRAILNGPVNRHRIAFSNPEFVLEAMSNDDLREYLNSCSLNLIDGVGILHAFRAIHGVRAPGRITGTNFVAMVCEESVLANARVFLFGGRPGVAARASAVLQSRYRGLDVCGVADGFGSAEGALQQIRAARPDVLMVCLGNPRQERWLQENLHHLDVKLAFGNGGALDFWSGDVPKAPSWVQRAGIEWLFRLVTNFSMVRLKRQLRLVKFLRLVVRARREQAERCGR